MIEQKVAKWLDKNAARMKTELEENKKRNICQRH
jgi:hypothetical protein